ncbi:DinB family protein [Flammeovirgaceae bacterium SG7u.111]|nr:DinB family protein [Flammeovirgaceae bacterium SG7u.132]WPO34657.1 DinB family protein [Flammeovirgaceae bacterium SG7u.111]
MKKLLPFILLALLGFEATAQRQKSFSKQFMPTWENATEYTLAVANLMPPEKYDYKPSDGQLTFAQLMVHIAENLSWINSTYIMAEENPMKSDDYDGLGKDEVIALLEQSFKYTSKSIGNLNDLQITKGVKFAGENLSIGQMVYLMRDHMTHHRAQAIVYLRMNGIKPPTYVGW